MDTLSFALELKAAEEAGVVGRFRGLGSVYGNKDLHGDVVIPGAFTATLKAKGGRVPLLWQHDTTEPIGLAVLSDSKDGLVVEGEIDLETVEGRRAYSGIKRGYVRGLSIGYDTKKDKFVNGRRELHEIDLWEMSIVTFGANPQATITQVKANEEAARQAAQEFANWLRMKSLELRMETVVMRAGRLVRESEGRV